MQALQYLKRKGINMNLGAIAGVAFYLSIAIVALIIIYLSIRALQAVIGIEKTLKELVSLETDKEKKKEEREMRRI